MSNKLKAPTAEEVRALRGMEFTLVFGKINGTLAGTSTKAYVAQADKNIGITIKGLLPANVDNADYGIFDDNDIVLGCCQCYGNPDREDYIRCIASYVDLIKSGIFYVDLVDYDGEDDSGNAHEMESSCPFS